MVMTLTLLQHLPQLRSVLVNALDAKVVLDIISLWCMTYFCFQWLQYQLSWSFADMYVINSQIALFNPLLYHTSDYLINVLDPIVSRRQYFFSEYFHCCLTSVSSDS